MLHEVNELIVTDDMHQRKMLMFQQSDAFVALPGGIGTLEELVEQLTWSQLGRHSKPIMVANIDGFWTPFLSLLKHMRAETFIRDGLEVGFTVVDSADQILPAAIAAAHGAQRIAGTPGAADPFLTTASCAKAARGEFVLLAGASGHPMWLEPGQSMHVPASCGTSRVTPQAHIRARRGSAAGAQAAQRAAYGGCCWPGSTAVVGGADVLHRRRARAGVERGDAGAVHGARPAHSAGAGDADVSRAAGRSARRAASSARSSTCWRAAPSCRRSPSSTSCRA